MNQIMAPKYKRLAAICGLINIAKELSFSYLFSGLSIVIERLG